MVSTSVFGKVGLIYGGTSSERDVSLRSGKAVAKALDYLGIPYALLDAEGYDLMTNLKKEGFDRCLIMQHGGQGENGILQSLLDTMHMPYTGSCRVGCLLSMDKLISKSIWQRQGLPIPKARKMMHAYDVEGLNFPLAVKPVAHGSSVGISKVLDHSQLELAYQSAAKYGEVLAEEWIEGKEITVSIVNGNVLPPIWIEPSRTFYDYEAKYNATSNTRYHCPSGLNEAVEKKLKETALEAFQVLHCSGWGRVDLIIDRQMNPYLIEANTVPGMTELSLVPQAANVYGWDFNQLVLEILKTSLK